MAENSVSDTETEVCDNAKYSIMRYFAPHLRRSPELIDIGLTLEEAQEYCSRDDTREPGEWFDGYMRE